MRGLSLVLAASAIGCLAAQSARADRIVLRNLKIISDRQVESFDEDGVKLDDGATLTWDEIETGKIDPAKQEEFDRQLAALGPPLFQIRQRLTRGDYLGLLEPAEAVYPTYAARRSRTAYLVCQALMWGRLAAGKREQAVEPYLRCYAYLSTYESTDAVLPGDRRLAYDPKTAMSPELAPVWFDAEAAKGALPGVVKAAGELPKPILAGARVYYATLALAAGDLETGRNAINGLRDEDPGARELRDIVLAQAELLAGGAGEAVARLEESLDEVSAESRPLALYWLGRAKIASDDPSLQREGVLQLLHLPAVFGQKHPDLAAAGLYDAMQSLAALGEDSQSVAVRKELLQHYANSPQAEKVKSASSAGGG